MASKKSRRHRAPQPKQQPEVPPDAQPSDQFDGVSAELRAIIDDALANPTEVGRWRIAISALISAGRLAEADLLVERASEEIQTDEAMMAQWAEAARRQNTWPEALRRAELLIARYPDTARHHMFAIYGVDRVLGYDAALARIHAWMERFPGDVHITGPAADVALRREDWSRAVEFLDMYAAVGPLDERQAQQRAMALSKVAATGVAAESQTED